MGSGANDTNVTTLTCVCVLAVACLVGACTTDVEQSTDGQPALRVDVRDPRAVAGFADLVFVGTVRSKVGEEPSDPSAGARYRVAIVDKIKGTTTGDVLVNLDRIGDDTGGASKELTIGGTYLLSARMSTRHGWYTLVPQVGGIRLTKEEALAVHRKPGADPADPPAVRRMRDAVANEIPFKTARPRPKASPSRDSGASTAPATNAAPSTS